MIDFLKLVCCYCVVLSLSIPDSFSQQTGKFSENQETFINEFTAYISPGIDKDQKKILEQFKLSWVTGKYSIFQKDRFISLCNLMSVKKAKSDPHFLNLIKIAEMLLASQPDSLNFTNFISGFDSLLNTKKVTLNSVGEFLNNVVLLVQDTVIYKSGSITWKTNTTGYQFIFDSVFRIRLPLCELQCFNGKNSIKINSTKGEYNPLQLVWNGKGGIVYWDRAGLDPEKLFVQLQQYNIDFTRAFYKADSVKLTNKYYFNFTMNGSFEDKVMNYTAYQDVVYPKFISYQQTFEIKNIFEGIDYKGGFTMQGEKFIGSGSRDEPASLTIFRKVEVTKENALTIEDKLFMYCTSMYFAFRENNITGKNTAVKIYLDSDSIYHPGLLFRYFNQNREVNLVRNDDPETLSKRKYYDSYHKLDLDFELLSWKMNEPFVYFTMQKGSSINTAVFTSENYFNYADFLKIQGIADVHPYAVMRSFIRKIGRNDFSCEEYANYLKTSYSTARSILINLFYQGVIDFDLNTDEGIVKQRLFDMLQFYVGQKDYDQIDFYSTVEAPKHNAVMNLKNFDLQINGVPRIQVSDSQNVVIIPTNQEILMSRNRNFVFSGTVQTGLFTFYGQKFRFVYDSFKIELKTVDSLKLKVKAGLDNWGRRKVKTVTSLIEDISGEVLIDNPSNKSGVKRLSYYPIFESRQPSYVYYDKSSKYKNLYKRNKFYFKIYPYTIDSLNSFSIEGFGYKGKLYSADILEPLEETLILQPDYSLGMTHIIGESGMDVYKKSGKFYNQISLSNQGLEGDGKLVFINSVTFSRQLTFFPDSANGVATQYEISEEWKKIKFPKVKGTKNIIRWKPYEQYLITHKTENPFEIYQNSSFHGTLRHDATSLTGYGKLEYKNADFSSSSFNFKENRFTSEITHFVLKSTDRKEIIYEVKKVDALYDFTKRKGEFINKNELSLMYFYPNQYKAYGEKIIWYEDKNELGLVTDSYAQSFENFVHKAVPVSQKGDLLTGSLFISTHKKQDSLNFISVASSYNLNNNILTCSDVKLVYVADAVIYPAENRIVIDDKGKMQTLQKAVIIANRETSYHKFYETLTHIQGRLSYTSEGYYDYKDENGLVEKIHFTAIGVDSLTQTFASGKIIEDDNFTLSPAFKYMGRVYLKAPDKFLRFSGSAKLTHECNITRTWFKFDTVIDPYNIAIPIQPKPVDINNNNIFSGIFISSDSIHLFPAFLSYNRNYADKPIITSTGILIFDKKLGKYIIASPQRIANPEEQGNLINLHSKICNLSGQGKLEPGLNTKQLKYEIYGNATYDVVKKEFDCEGIVMFDFLFNEKCLKLMADTILSAAGLQGMNIGSSVYQNAIKEIIGTAGSVDFMKELRTFGTVKKLPKELYHSLVLSNVSLKWNDVTNSYKSQGKIGVGSILDMNINLMLDGYVEMVRKRSGDIIAIYLEVDKKTWFFFYYQRGILQSVSSIFVYNETIRNMKESERQMKGSKAEDDYLFFLGTERKKNDFIKQFLQSDKETETGDEIINQDEDINNQ